jgi:hypothetical protein
MTIPNLFLMEIGLTYRCNVKCNNCSSLCTQAPAIGDIAVSDIQRFVNESAKQFHPWQQITLHGGEPVLHPKFDSICKIIAGYRDRFNHGCRIQLLTNWSTPAIQNRAESACKEYGFILGASMKTGSGIDCNGKPIPYVTVNNSPIDNGESFGFGCYISRDCGVYLNYLGYFECSVAAATARVFNYQPIAKHLSDLTVDACQLAYKQHCGNCGFANINLPRESNQVTSKTWKIGFSDYARKNVVS